MNKYIYKIKKKIMRILIFINKQRHRYLLMKTVPAEKDEISAVNYIKKYGVDTFTNKLCKKYIPDNIKVFYDEVNDMKYVFLGGKKLYMPKVMCDEEIQDYIAFVCSEQDINSPHCYASLVDVPNESVVVDIGAAEGNFSLEVIDKVSKVYLFECNSKWKQALQETFKPYGDKVVIINERVDSKHPLDSFLKEVPDIIKIDTEGCEKEIIFSSNIILNKKSSLIIATYHRGKDADEIKRALIDIGFNIKFSKGLMIFLYKFKTTHPILRKGLMLAER